MNETAGLDLDRCVTALEALLTDLGAYVDRKAAGKAAPAIAEAERAVNEAIQEAQAELQRERDLVAELRRQADARDKTSERARQRIALALGMDPCPRSWDILVTEVERRTGEDAATIERLRGELRDAIQGHLVTNVPLPAMSGEGGGDDG